MTNPFSASENGRIIGVALCAGFLLLLIELGGIWKEVHQIRVEQVKSQWYAEPQEVRERVRRLPKGEQVRKNYESTSNVVVDGGSVDVNVQDQPVEVQIDQ